LSSAGAHPMVATTAMTVRASRQHAPTMALKMSPLGICCARTQTPILSAAMRDHRKIALLNLCPSGGLGDRRARAARASLAAILSGQSVCRRVRESCQGTACQGTTWLVTKVQDAPRIRYGSTLLGIPCHVSSRSPGNC
jgi:hypothetical protein